MIRLTDSREYQKIYVEVVVFFDSWQVITQSDEIVGKVEKIDDFSHHNAEWEPEKNGYVADFFHEITISTSRCRHLTGHARIAKILEEEYEKIFNASFSVEAEAFVCL